MSRTLSPLLRAGCVLALALPASLSAQSAGSLIAVHGFLTQGYGSTNGEPTAGLTNQASANYHNATLQLFGRVTSNDQVVIQLNNQHIGSNGLGDVDNRFNVDWAYASHRFDNGITVKAGKLPMPRGIYNEIRAAGTVLPFYRAPIISYSEGYETVRGASVTRSFFVESEWELDATAYAGNWDSNSQRYSAAAPNDPAVRTSFYDHTIGGQLWLSTPVEGLRLGLAGLGYHSNGTQVTGDSITPSSDPTRRAVVASVDGDFERFMVRSEVRHQWYLERSTSQRDYYYAQAGLKLPAGFSVNVQGEAENQERVNRVDSTTYRYVSAKDMALGGRFAFRPNLVFKLEQHWTFGRSIDRYVASTEDTPRVNYMLASASVGF